MPTRGSVDRLWLPLRIQETLDGIIIALRDQTLARLILILQLLPFD